MRAEGGRNAIDVGTVCNGRVVFPNWRGPEDRPSVPPPEKAQAVGRHDGIEPHRILGMDDWPKIAADPAIEAVYVVTPNALHRDHVLAAAGAGKHVLCEKPMATSSAAAPACA